MANLDPECDQLIIDMEQSSPKHCSEPVDFDDNYPVKN